MPGYNHYPDCTCGWCVKYGGYSLNRRTLQPALKSQFEIGNARQLLKEYKVRDYVTACFVNPNARCPVCGASVYYYQNAAGSRVFFDDLGPPWPKHPCTDNMRLSSSALSVDSEKPTPRKRGIATELVTAAIKTGLYDGRFFGEDGLTEHWTPIEVVSVQREGWQNIVEAQYLESDEREMLRFGFASSENQLAPGDIVSLRRAEISVFDMRKLKERRYKIEMIK